MYIYIYTHASYAHTKAFVCLCVRVFATCTHRLTCAPIYIVCVRDFITLVLVAHTHLVIFFFLYKKKINNMCVRWLPFKQASNAPSAQRAVGHSARRTL
jgi:hypothetical protein